MSTFLILVLAWSGLTAVLLGNPTRTLSPRQGMTRT
jgi:hypothetical protein